MRLRLSLRLVLASLLLLALAAAAPAEPSGREPIGRWLTQDRDGVIEISPCGSALCGRIIGLDTPKRPDGSEVRDNQGRPQCGLPILQVIQIDTGRWDGRITDPDNGTVWHCALWLDGQGRLNLRGYVLLPALGQTQVWTRFAGVLGADCAMN